MKVRKGEYSEEFGGFKSTVITVGAIGTLGCGVNLYEGNFEVIWLGLICLAMFVGGFFLPNARWKIEGDR